LQHHLADEHRPRVTGVSPRKVAAVPGPPAQQGAAGARGEPVGLSRR
jgi:hypothetical protein